MGLNSIEFSIKNCVFVYRIVSVKIKIKGLSNLAQVIYK